MTPLWAGGVSPSGTSPFSSFTSSLVAVIILFLAIPPLPAAFTEDSYTTGLLADSCFTAITPGAEELWWEYEFACGGARICAWLHMWLRLRLCLSVTDKHLSLSCSFFFSSVKTRTSARTSGARCVVPGAARTPSALTGAWRVASPALRENSSQAVVSVQKCTTLKRKLAHTISLSKNRPFMLVCA